MDFICLYLYFFTSTVHVQVQYLFLFTREARKGLWKAARSMQVEKPDSTTSSAMKTRESHGVLLIQPVGALLVI